MKAFLKAGGLILLLVIPVLIFLFLKNFGKNHFTVRKYYPIGFDANSNSKQTDTIYHKVPDFKLTNQDGNEVTRAAFDGKIFVTDFFFTTCPSICPKMTTELLRVQDAFVNDPDIRIASITVNPSFDTVEVLKNYAKRYGSDPAKWAFLTGDKKVIYDLARNGFFLSALQGDGGPEDFIHSEKLILVDKEGIIRGYYDGTDKEEVDRLVTEIRILKSEYENNK